MTTSWMATTIARENDTSTAMTPDDSSSWRPLAIALPVCLVGIPLVTVIVIVLITCYRSKFKHKENSIFGRKLTAVNSDQSEAAEIENEAGGNRTENHASVYANLSETVEEARSKEAMGNNTSSGNSTGSNSSNSSNSGLNKIAKGIHWPPTVLWKKRQVSITENAEAEKNTMTANGTNHKDKRKEKAEREEDSRTTDIEAKISGTGVDRTLGESTAETPTTAGNLMKVNGVTVGLHGVPMRQKKETTTYNNRQYQNTDNAATTTTTTTTTTMVTAKPSQTDTRKTFVVMYPMDSDETTNHLPLAVNDVIFFMDEEKDGWMKGEKKESGEVGWFPRTYVREGMSPLVKRHSMHAKTDASSETNDKTTTTTTTTSARATMATMMMTTTQQCDNDNDNDAFEDFDDDDDDDETGIEYQALYPYRATEDGDVNFDAGDVIVVVEKQDNGWWYGYHGDDHGFFPGSYVQISRTDELSQTLSHPSSQATGDSGPAAGDAAVNLDDDPEMLLTLAEEDEDEIHDDDDALDQQKQNNTTKKKKLSSARKSLGVFLMSLPHKIASASNRPAGNTDVTGQVGSPVVTSDPTTTTTETLKTKKSDRIVIPTAVKKKTNHKMKIKKTKNDRNLGPMARRSSLAPSPPQSGPQGAVAGALAKGVMSGLAQMVAAEAAKLRHDGDDDPMNTTYEEIGTTGLFSPTTRTTTEFNLSDSNEIPIYEIVETLNSRGVVSDGRRSPTSAAAAAAAPHVFDANRNDVGSTHATPHETYSNIGHAVQSIAWPKESSNRKGQETKRTEDNKLHREDKNQEQFEVKNKEQFEVKNKEQLKARHKEQFKAKHEEQLKLALMSTSKNHNSSSRKPIPPLKPSYIGSSTPNIAELLKAIESRNDGRVGKSPGNKPRTLAKPGRNNPRGGRGSDLGLTGTDLSMVLPPSLQKPKPLTEKPRYLSPGFPHGGLHQASKPDQQQLQRRDIYRSLDSIMVAAAEAESDEDEDDAAGELEIMKWLRRKQSVEEEELTGRGLEVAGRGLKVVGGGDGGGSKLNGVGKESQQMQIGKTKDISDGAKQNVEQVDGARIALMFESLSKAGLNEESFV